MPPTPEQEQIIRAHNLGLLATLKRDGSPQVTPVNYVYHEGRFLISTTRSRAKYPNVKHNPRVALCVIHPEGRPYVTVYGSARVEEDDVVDGTAEIFRGIADRPLPDNFAQILRDQGRVLIVLTPERFVP